MAVQWSLIRAAVKLSLFQVNSSSYSIPHTVKCRTVVINFSRSLETWKMLKIISSKLKFIKKYQNQWYHTKLGFNMNLAQWFLTGGTRTPWGYQAPEQGVRSTNIFRHTRPENFKDVDCRLLSICCECSKLCQKPNLESRSVQSFL